MSARVPPWLPLFPSLPSLFLPTNFNIPVREKTMKEKQKGKFSIENLLPQETKTAATVLPISIAPVSREKEAERQRCFQVLPTPSIEFVNGGYGVKNPLAGSAASEATAGSSTGEEGKFVCRICGKVRVLWLPSQSKLQEVHPPATSKPSLQMPLGSEEISLYLLREGLQ